jgi:hypothetical protein
VTATAVDLTAVFCIFEPLMGRHGPRHGHDGSGPFFLDLSHHTAVRFSSLVLVGIFSFADRLFLNTTHMIRREYPGSNSHITQRDNLPTPNQNPAPAPAPNRQAQIVRPSSPITLLSPRCLSIAGFDLRLDSRTCASNVSPSVKSLAAGSARTDAADRRLVSQPQLVSYKQTL